MKKNTILVVDDCLIHQKMIKSLAEIRGYDVEVLDDGIDVIIRTKSDTDDVCAILLDIFMPMVDGISALGQLRHKHPNIPVIIISSTEDKEILASVESLGVQAIIQKPMTAEKIAHIFTLIESHQK